MFSFCMMLLYHCFVLCVIRCGVTDLTPYDISDSCDFTVQWQEQGKNRLFYYNCRAEVKVLDVSDIH